MNLNKGKKTTLAHLVKGVTEGGRDSRLVELLTLH